MKFNLIFILALISEILCAQINEHKYFGTIILENNAPMSFSLDLIEKNGLVSGYSITNHNNENETKATINITIADWNRRLKKYFINL